MSKDKPIGWPLDYQIGTSQLIKKLNIELYSEEENKMENKVKEAEKELNLADYLDKPELLQLRNGKPVVSVHRTVSDLFIVLYGDERKGHNIVRCRENGKVYSDLVYDFEVILKPKPVEIVLKAQLMFRYMSDSLGVGIGDRLYTEKEAKEVHGLIHWPIGPVYKFTKDGEYLGVDE